jgi:hypothetical protein
MIWIKSFRSFKESIVINSNFVSNILVDLNESLKIWHDLLLTSIDAEEVSIYDTFHLPREKYQNKLDLEILSNDTEFINALSSIGLKKSTIENTDGFETFVNKSCRFMLIYRIEANELENPEYLMFQIWSDTLNKWEDIKLYKVNGDIKKFYDKLSSKTIELDDSLNKYIYVTSNGNEWILQNVEKSNKEFKKYLRKDELDLLVKNKKLKITII